jgi:phage I-like protein
MQRALSNRLSTAEVSHVAAAIGAASGLLLAVAQAGDRNVAFGVGVELALTRVADVETVPEWVQLFPKGPVITARDGRTWTLPDPHALVAAFTANQADLPFDINHATELKAPKGEDAPAQGWIKALEIRDGLVWARVEWNEAGRLVVLSKAYRYVSPGFLHTKDGKIVAVTSAALVTHPALVMPALAQQQPNPPENSMSLAIRLAAVLGLAATATEDQIVDAVSPTIALARDARDPTKLVPAADLQAALARATAAEATIPNADAAA